MNGKKRELGEYNVGDAEVETELAHGFFHNCKNKGKLVKPARRRSLKINPPRAVIPKCKSVGLGLEIRGLFLLGAEAEAESERSGLSEIQSLR